MKKALVLMAAVMLVAAMAGVAIAGLPNATVVVTGNLAGVCHFDVVPALNLTLDPVAGPVTANGNLTFWCTNGTNWTITDPDAVSDGSYAGTLTCTTPGTCGANSIGYTLTYTNFSGGPATGRTTSITSALQASVPLVNFQDQPTGTYVENVVFTIAP